MEVNELMVGDWVSYCGFYNKVIYIGQKVSMYDEKGTEFTTDPEHIRRIPLTEEILVKNGFALDKTLAVIGTKVYTRPCPAGDLSVKVFHDGSIRFGFIKLTYVHQLQHLLRLAGVQKEIEL